MEKIMVYNQKGGVGKSTSVVNIAGCLSKQGKKVLVCDIDGQCTASSYLSVINGQTEKNILDCIINNEKPENVIIPIFFKKWNNTKHDYIKQDTNIFLLPSSKNINNENFRTDWKDYDFFVELFKNNYFKQFDYLIFDCPGYISNLTESALRVCDYIVVPAFADLDSLVGYNDLIDTKNRIRQNTNNTSIDILGVFFTSVSGSSVNKQIIDFCNESMGSSIIFNSTIRRSSIALDARVVGKPLSYYKPKTAIAQDYVTLTKELISKVSIRKDT